MPTLAGEAAAARVPHTGCQALEGKTPGQPSSVPLTRLLLAHGILPVTVTGPALQVGHSTDLEIL